jgi:hypothetical protein
MADSLYDQIDQLYRLPLDEFTAARNALAKQAGPSAPQVKQLEKPSTAAWAVNQLFWQQRKLYDDVIGAASRRRDAYRQLLAGKNTDAAHADDEHRAAIRAAAHASRAILERAGHSPTDAVMTAVSETLDALPGTESPGRLTKSLKRIGFDGLEGVPVAPAPKKVTPIGARPAKPGLSAPTVQLKQAAEAGARDMAMARERLRFAEAAEREAREVMERAQRSLDRAERTRERIEEELAEANDAVKKARKEEASAKTAYDKAIAERKHLERKLP